MGYTLLVARLVLAGVFAAAGVAKLADWKTARAAISGFGIPFPNVVGAVLPVAELATAAALVPVSTAWSGAVGALVLLSLFTGAIGINLVLGRRPDCRCFGQLQSRPIGWSTLARNAALMGLAALIVLYGRANPGASAISWLADLSIAERVALFGSAVAIGIGATALFLMLQLISQNGRLLIRLEELEASIIAGSRPETPRPHVGLPIGSRAPAFRLSGISGETYELPALGSITLLLFVDPGCGPCNDLMPEVAQWQQQKALQVILVATGGVEAGRSKHLSFGVSNYFPQQNQEVASAYLAEGTPSAVVIRPDGAIGSAVAMGPEAIRALLIDAMQLSEQASMVAHRSDGVMAAPRPPEVGSPAPAFDIPDLTGQRVGLSDLRNSRTLILFWNPGCGFCQKMLPDLRIWESSSSKVALRFLLISAGSVEANRSMELRSTILLDPTFSTGTAYGVDGTPSSIVIDATGEIASPLAIGIEAIHEQRNAQLNGIGHER
jgi:thiol-disulfide isomerase/thioredoxin